jgi:L-alanine-DL-glutamate epimerase-like enolase superfamily enzyme
MIERATAHGLRVMIGCMLETSLGVTAAAHLSPLCDYADLDGNLLLRNDPFRRCAGESRQASASHRAGPRCRSASYSMMIIAMACSSVWVMVT